MSHYDSAVSLRLAKKIAETVESETDHLINGAAATLDDYKRRTGYLKALSDVTTWLSEIESDLNRL